MLLQTRRLVVRRFHEGDAPALAAYRSDPEIARYQSWSVPVSLEAARTLIHEAGTHDAQLPGWTQYAVELRSDHTLIGDVGVNLHENRMQAEIGFTVAAQYQGSGYASETIRRLLEHLFTTHGLHHISAECDARNLRSARLLEKLGFQREGYRVANTWLKGEWTDDILFGLLAQDWWRTSS